MPHAVARTARLVCHRASCSDAVRGVSVSVQRAADELMLNFTIEADVARLRIPPARASVTGHELWKHTCCECFIALKGEPAYHEYNFSPSGEWAVYAFAKYREGAPRTDVALDPRIAVCALEDRIELNAAIALARLSERYRGKEVMLGLSAVIEDAVGALTYWALAHPAEKPDFHRRETFLLELPPP
ncbi:MAG: DOMON-like domain-containing protein [Betaproteobacteria bacterium]